MVINSLPLSGVERDALNGFTQRSSHLRSSRPISPGCRRSTHRRDARCPTV